MFTHLHLHSHYSLLEAIGKPADIVARAVELGMQAVALTDYNGMYGAVEFYQACQQADIKPIIGVELGLVHEMTDHPKKEDTGNIVLIAKNTDGYQTLLELVSLANTRGRNGKARIDFDTLTAHAKGNLFGLQEGRHSYLGKMVLHGEKIDKIIETLGLFHAALGDGHLLLGLIAQDHKLLPPIEKINQQLHTLADQHHLPLICNTNTHYLRAEDDEAFEVALAIKDGKRIYDKDRRKVVGDRSLQSADQVRKLMLTNGYTDEQVDAMFTTSQQIVDQVDCKIPLGTILFPNYTTPDHIRQLYEQHKDQLIETAN